MDTINAIRQFLADNSAQAALISSASNRRYVSGFKGSTGYVLITSSKALFLTDFRYVEQAKIQCPKFEIVSIKGEADLFAYLKDNDLKKIALEVQFVSISFSEKLTKNAQITHYTAIDELLQKIRMIKTSDEISNIKKALKITKIAYENLLKQVEVGMSENNIDAILQNEMRQHKGVERMAEKFIVASGENGALPHGVATDRAVQKGDFVTIDFGCNYNGYWSDITRTFCLGKASDEQKKIYQTVLDAQIGAIKYAKAKLTGRQVDSVARDIITNAGYGDYFGHGLGHSMGLDVHENPRFAQNELADTVLLPGMVMTVEPGIYIPGFGGVRIEDNIVITENGNDNLTDIPKHLIELDV